MKHLRKIFIAITSVAFLMSCSPDSYLVSSDRSPGAELNKYESWAWTSHAKVKDNTIYTLNDFVLKTNVMNNIEEEMQGLGYSMNQDDPELLVSFLVFDKPTEFRGYGVTNDEDFYYDYWAGFDVDEELGEIRSYNFEEGSLVIQMVDKKSGEMIWQGYASGIMDGQMFDRDSEKIAEAVELIFEEFNARGDEYTN